MRRRREIPQNLSVAWRADSREKVRNVENIGNLPKFNIQTGDLAGAVQYNLDQVKVVHICQRRREEDLQWRAE